MIKRGVSSESFTMNADTDLGPLVSLELNSLFPSSLYQVSPLYLSYCSNMCTLRSHLKAVGSRIALQECGGTRPSAPKGVRNMSNFGQLTFGLLMVF